MEELVSTAALEREILADARKKAERALRGADEDVARAAADGERRAAAAVAELERSLAEKTERYRSETLARLPLERSRIKAAFVDGRIREALDAFMAVLPEREAAAMVAAALAKARPFLDGKRIRVRRRQLGEGTARSILAEALPTAEVLELAEDPALPAAGLVAETEDGGATMRATINLVEEALLEERRGELAAALCGEALAL